METVKTKLLETRYTVQQLAGMSMASCNHKIGPCTLVEGTSHSISTPTFRVGGAR